MRSASRRRGVGLRATGAVLALAVLGGAQEAPAPAKAKAPEARAPVEAARPHPAEMDLHGLQVPAHSDVRAWLAAEREAEGRKDWEGAARLLERLIEEEAFPFVKTAEDETGILYRPVRAVVNEQAAGWPAEGRKAYERRFGEKFFLALKRNPLSKVIEKYPCVTGWGNAALDEVDSSLQRGDLQKAFHYLYKIDTSLKPFLEKSLQDAFARTYQACLERATKAAAEASKPDSSPGAQSWPMPGGGPTRTLPMPQGSGVFGAKALDRSGARVEFRIPAERPLPDGLWTAVENQALQRSGTARFPFRRETVGRDLMLEWAGLDIASQVPATLVTPEMELNASRWVGGERITTKEKERLFFVQWPDQVLSAYRLNSGKIVWAAHALGDKPPGVLPRFEPAAGPAREAAPPERRAFAAGPAPAASKTTAYFVQTDPALLDRMPPPRALSSVLAACDVMTGKILWSVGNAPARLKRPEDDPFLSGCLFLGSPLPAGGRLYAAAHHPDGFFLLCLSEENAPGEGGKLLWKARLAAGPLEPSMTDPDRLTANLPVQIPDVRLAADGVHVVAALGRGIVAAADAFSGEILWLRKYKTADRLALDRPGAGARKAGGRRPWDSTGLVLLPDLVIAAPADSDTAIALDRRTGKVRWVSARLEPPATGSLAGTTQGLLVFAGPGIELVQPANGKRIYRWPEKGRDGFGPEGIRARGFAAVGERDVLVPTDKGIVRFDVAAAAALAAKGMPGQADLAALKPGVLKPPGWDDRPWALSLFGDFLFLAGESEIFVYRLAPPEAAKEAQTPAKEPPKPETKKP